MIIVLRSQSYNLCTTVSNTVLKLNIHKILIKYHIFRTLLLEEDGLIDTKMNFKNQFVKVALKGIIAKRSDCKGIQ